ncbi:MAG TPA: hypothetical protein PKO15_07355 [Fibrobacteria bacterium]|nr:hypothetical protein [Fibrobacteria bacterium]HOX52189.1 hypothetical protein [Fibrobacteria bacterium]
MIHLLPIALALSAAPTLQTLRCDGVCTPTPSGMDIVVPLGDTVQFSWQGLRAHRGPKEGVRLDGQILTLSPVAVGKTNHRLATSSGRDPWELTVEGVPLRRLDLEIRAVGTDPRVLRWKARVVETEINRLLGRSGLSLSFTQGSPIYLDRKEWDLNRNERLDLWRNGTVESPAPEQVKLVGQLLRRGLEFPKVVLLQEKSRVGWSPKEEVRAGDTLLRLADNDPLVWRDRQGTPMRYVLESPRRDRSDTFLVTGYLPGGALRIATSSGGWKWDHPITDLVLRPDLDAPAFGFVDLTQEKAPPVLLIPATDTSSMRHARILAHEVGHLFGLRDTSAGNNLMSALLRMEIADPVLEAEQVRDLARRMTEMGIPTLDRARR